VCRADTDEEVAVVFSSGPDIRAYFAKSRREAPLIVEDGHVAAVDFDPKLEMVYWVDATHRTIKRSFMIGAQKGLVKTGHAQDLEMESKFYSFFSFQGLHPDRA